LGKGAFENSLHDFVEQVNKMRELRSAKIAQLIEEDNEFMQEIFDTELDEDAGEAQKS